MRKGKLNGNVNLFKKYRFKHIEIKMEKINLTLLLNTEKHNKYLLQFIQNLIVYFNQTIGNILMQKQEERHIFISIAVRILLAIIFSSNLKISQIIMMTVFEESPIILVLSLMHTISIHIHGFNK